MNANSVLTYIMKMMILMLMEVCMLNVRRRTAVPISGTVACSEVG